MNNTTILKILDLLKQDNKQEIKEILTKELLNGEDKTKAKLFASVKSYLKKMDNSRPKLKAIQIRDGKQFILNGYNMFIFKDYKTELDNLPQETEDTLPYENILYKDKEQTELTKDDIFVLQNLKKYISWYKTQDCYEKKQMIAIPFDNKIFDTDLLLDIYNICDHDFETWQKCITTENISATQIMTNDTIIFVLPLRTPHYRKEPDLYNTTTEMFEKFKQELKNN